MDWPSRDRVPARGNQDFYARFHSDPSQSVYVAVISLFKLRILKALENYILL